MTFKSNVSSYLWHTQYVAGIDGSHLVVTGILLTSLSWVGLGSLDLTWFGVIRPYWANFIHDYPKVASNGHFSLDAPTWTVTTCLTLLDLMSLCPISLWKSTPIDRMADISWADPDRAFAPGIRVGLVYPVSSSWPIVQAEEWNEVPLFPLIA